MSDAAGQSILRFHAIGDWPPGSIRVQWMDSTHHLPPDIAAQTEQIWQEALARRGVNLFDGPMCRLESWSADERQLRLILSPTTYKAFLATNMCRPHLADQYGPAVLANPVGVSAALVAADNHVLMGRRNGRVAYYPDRIHPFAGTLEPSANLDVFADMQRELAEELSLRSTDIADMRCLGMAEDCSLRQPELIFLVRSTRSLDEIEFRLDRAEHHATWSIPATVSATNAAFGDIAPFTPIAVATLLLWGRHAFGDAWFNGRCAEFGL